MVVMPEIEVHGQVGQLQLGATRVGRHMTERKQKAEIFWEQYSERYTGEENTEVHPTISGMMHNYNKNFYELRISKVCMLAGVKFY